MKKIIVIAIISALILCMFTSCDANYTLLDTNYTYDIAMIEMPGGEVIKVEIKSWRDYEGEQLQIIAKDGTVYLTSSYNCVLINEK